MVYLDCGDWFVRQVAGGAQNTRAVMGFFMLGESIGVVARGLIHN